MQSVRGRRGGGQRSRARRLAVLVAALLGSLWIGVALANPAYPGLLEVLDGTGNTLQIRSHGDEFFSYATTRDGDLVWRDGWGSYHYILDRGNAYALGERVFDATPRFPRLLSGASPSTDAGERVNTGTAGEDFKQKLEAFYASQSSGIALFSLRGTRSQLEGYTPEEGVDPLFGKWVEEGKGFTQPDMPERGGVCPLLILKIQYADTPCLFTDQEWHDRIFGGGGVTAYYNEVSNGRFTYVPAMESGGTANDGVITVTLPIPQPRYENQYTGHNFDKGAKADLYTSTDGRHKYAIYNNASLYAYGLEAASQSIAFGQYDARHDSYYNGNGDGYISPTELAVLVVNAGYEASFGLSAVGDPATWASSWCANNWWIPDEGSEEVDGVAGGILLDGVQLYKFTIVGENLCGSPANTNYRKYDYSKTRAQNEAEGNAPFQGEIGTSCHELGHDLGLQDLYDTSGSPAHERDVGALSLMATGNWGVTPEEYVNGRPGSSPTHLDAYSKIRLGFYQAQNISASGVYPVAHASDSGNYNILRVNTDDPDVYYLIENRTFTGFDRGMYCDLDAPSGVVYWRIDEGVVRARYKANKVNNTPGPYGIVPEYVYYAYSDAYQYFFCKPYHNSVTYADYPAKRVFALPEKPTVSLTCYDAAAPRMDVWLNCSAPIPLTLMPDGSFPVGAAGSDLTMVLGAGSSITLSDLAWVTMDGNPLLSPSQYEARTGSIILTLKKAYLDTLAPGVHTLRVTLRNGMVAEAKINVYEPSVPPQTGDASTPGLWAGLALLALILAGVGGRKARARRETV